MVMNDDWKNFEPRRNAPIEQAPKQQAVILAPRIARTAEDMARMASTYTDASLEALGRIVENPNARPMELAAAARELLSRAHGTPAVTTPPRANQGATIDAIARQIQEHDPEGWQRSEMKVIDNKEE